MAVNIAIKNVMKVRINKVGVWSLSKVIAPWEYRKAKKNKTFIEK